jgi:hypothetical protein
MKKDMNNIDQIYPGESEQVNYWTRKWGITRVQLNEAILETGSIRVNEIKNYLKGKRFPISFNGLIHYLRLCI